MFWLSILNITPELDAIAPNTRPWSFLQKFWQFSQTYGEYQSLPPHLRRQFIIDREPRSPGRESHKPESSPVQPSVVSEPCSATVNKAQENGC